YNLGTGALFLRGGIYPRTMALLSEMGRKKQLVPWAGASELMDEDHSRYPVRLDSFFSFLRVPTLRLRDKLKIIGTGLRLLVSPGARNPFDGSQLAEYDSEENLENWSRANLGDKAFEYVMRPIMDFLYAVPLRELSTPFPKALIKQGHKISLSSPEGGIGQINEWFLDNVSSEKIHVSTPVEKLTREGQMWRVSYASGSILVDKVIIATEAFIAAELLKEHVSEDACDRLMSTHYTEYAHVAVGYDEDPWPDYPTDIVLPVGEGSVRNIGAMVLHGRRLPASVPDGAQMVGIYFNTPPLKDMSDNDIKEEAVRQVNAAFGQAQKPSFVHLFRYEKGLTIAKPGHYKMLDKVHSLLPEGIELAGDYFSQAGVEAAVHSGERAAKNLLRHPAREF
ncbi:MAG: FAD-dependent oxidoreductase, partial [Pseudomonadota bacterium]|nr:FAD-dependent oxidoreductase [Pseudomonadota bacterium]